MPSHGEGAPVVHVIETRYSVSLTRKVITACSIPGLERINLDYGEFKAMYYQ